MYDGGKHWLYCVVNERQNVSFLARVRGLTFFDPPVSHISLYRDCSCRCCVVHSEDLPQATPTFKAGSITADKGSACDTLTCLSSIE